MQLRAMSGYMALLQSESMLMLVAPDTVKDHVNPRVLGLQEGHIGIRAMLPPSLC